MKNAVLWHLHNMAHVRTDGSEEPVVSIITVT
jgi:hypothetical protein